MKRVAQWFPNGAQSTTNVARRAASSTDARKVSTTITQTERRRTVADAADISKACPGSGVASDGRFALVGIRSIASTAAVRALNVYTAVGDAVHPGARTGAGRRRLASRMAVHTTQNETPAVLLGSIRLATRLHDDVLGGLCPLPAVPLDELLRLWHGLGVDGTTTTATFSLVGSALLSGATAAIAAHSSADCLLAPGRCRARAPGRGGRPLELVERPHRPGIPSRAFVGPRVGIVDVRRVAVEPGANEDPNALVRLRSAPAVSTSSRSTRRFGLVARTGPTVDTARTTSRTIAHDAAAAVGMDAGRAPHATCRCQREAARAPDSEVPLAAISDPAKATV